MRHFFTLLLVIASLASFSQTSKWFVSVSTGATIGSPGSSMKNQVVEQGFNQTGIFNFLGLEFTTTFPRTEKNPNLLFRGGFKKDEYRSYYIIAGLANSGTVRGFKREGYTDAWFLGGTYGQYLYIDYKVYQVSFGYQYSFKGTRAKIGVAPSVFFLKYSITDTYTPSAGRKYQVSPVPGATATARIPLGKERRLVGVDLITEVNLAPPAKMNNDKNPTSFQAGSVNMTHASIGFALSFRRYPATHKK